MADYDPDLGGVANRMQDHAQMGGGRFLFQVGELLEHVHRLDSEGKGDSTLTALGCAVAFAWLLNEDEKGVSAADIPTGRAT